MREKLWSTSVTRGISNAQNCLTRISLNICAQMRCSPSLIFWQTGDLIQSSVYCWCFRTSFRIDMPSKHTICLAKWHKWYKLILSPSHLATSISFVRPISLRSVHYLSIPRMKWFFLWLIERKSSRWSSFGTVSKPLMKSWIGLHVACFLHCSRIWLRSSTVIQWRWRYLNFFMPCS